MPLLNVFVVTRSFWSCFETFQSSSITLTAINLSYLYNGDVLPLIFVETSSFFGWCEIERCMFGHTDYQKGTSILLTNRLLLLLSLFRPFLFLVLPII